MTYGRKETKMNSPGYLHAIGYGKKNSTNPGNSILGTPEVPA